MAGRGGASPAWGLGADALPRPLAPGGARRRCHGPGPRFLRGRFPWEPARAGAALCFVGPALCFAGPERRPQVNFKHVGLSRREKRHLCCGLRTPRTNLRLRGHIHLTTCVCVWRGMGGEESCRTQIPSFQQLPERSRMSCLYLSSLIFCANCFIKLLPHFRSSR